MPTRSRAGARRARAQAGSTLIEFTIVAFLLLLVMFAGIELDRMAFVYTHLADAAKAGVRYAIVHGADRSGSGADGPSGPADDPPEVVSVVTNYASMSIKPANLTVKVTYPNGSIAVGSQVKITVQYTYDPWVKLPLNVTLSAVSQGVIAF